MALDDSYRGKIDLMIVEDAGEVWLDMVDFEARFGRERLEERLAEAGLTLVVSGLSEGEAG
jgi:hypothetical protein